MPKLLYQATNINSDMVALNNEDPNAGAVVGTFGLLGLEKGQTFTAQVIPRNANVTGYQIEFAFYPSLRNGPTPPTLMWYYSATDLEVVALAGGGGTPEAQRLGGEFFIVEKPAGFDWGYVRISDITGTGNPGVDMMIWKDSP